MTTTGPSFPIKNGILSYTASTPEANIAFDQMLLDACDQHRVSFVLRFWESPTYFIVLGRGNPRDTEVCLTACHNDDISILRRMSGGGTVMQGPGCVNYSLVFRQDFSQHLSTVGTTNKWIMEQHQEALAKALPDISVKGVTDLCIGNRKFSGNAQRRTRFSVLFHGTFLYNFDLDLITRYLAYPSKVPAYRQHRNHDAFITNLPLSLSAITSLITKKWISIFPPH